VTEWLKEKREKEFREARIGFYRISLVPYCLRKQWYVYNNVKMPVNEELLRIFGIGELFHEFVEKIAKERYGSSVRTEVDVKIDLNGFSLVGRADLIIGDVVYELKTVKSLWYRTREGNFREMDLKKEHVEQLNCYLKGLGLKKGIVVYIDKRDLKMKQHEVRFSPRLWNRTVEKVRRLHRFLLENTPPLVKFGWECRMCEYKWLCFKEGEKKRQVEGVVAWK